ncbi:MAG: carbon-nitrogen hydrolase [Paludibacter sp.]|nr:carbon-nitrogen hydrolase [Paludibacter sp.]
MKAGIIQQHNCQDIELNKSKLEKNIRICAASGAQLIILPELHNSLYFCQTENISHFDYAETIPGESTDFFGKIAKELGIVLVLSLFEKRSAGVYHNTAVIIDSDGTIVGKYRKMHIPDDPGFFEKFYFTEGDLGFVPIKTSVGMLGVMICWDQWFPESARLMAMSGADILIYPTAIGWDKNDSKEEQARQCDAWITVQRGHAVANGLHVITCNRVGWEQSPKNVNNGILFWGSSFVAGAQGEIIAQASTTNEENIICEIDLSRTEQVRRIWPFFRDRRIDCFSDLAKRWRK